MFVSVYSLLGIIQKANYGLFDGYPSTEKKKINEGALMILCANIPPVYLISVLLG